MSHDCEYRFEGKGVYGLYVDGKPADMYIVGFNVNLQAAGPAVQTPQLWIGQGGGCEARRYSSRDAAIEGEKELLAGMSKAGTLQGIMLPPRNSEDEKSATVQRVIAEVGKLPLAAPIKWTGGVPAAHAGSHSCSIEELNRMIEQNPSAFAPYFERARMYMAGGQAGKAVDDYNRVIGLNLDDASVHANAFACRGAAYIQMRDFDSGINDCTRAIGLDPASLAGYFNRGSAYMMKKSYGLAIADFSAALRIEPNFAGAYLCRGDAYRNEKNYDGAIADYSRAIEFDPRNAALYNNRGRAWLESGNLDNAVPDFTRAVELDPKLVPAYLNRGSAFFKKKDYDGAIQNFEQALEFGVRDAHLYYNMGISWLYKGGYGRAVRAFDEAIRLDPGLMPAYQCRDQANRKLKNGGGGGGG
ncbi:MAG: tetratricopeptide repeat protein [Spirochaetaceae bacterium]|jgi:tetratricopeptide (TPR) repeat protein|nr:tetratricopeptide repeat protein [Spirochaetaceae bacterium]